MNEKLAGVDALGEESRGAFRKRVAKQKNKEKRDQTSGNGVSSQWRDFKLLERVPQTPRIMSFKLEAIDPGPEPESLAPGAHAKLKLPNGLVRSYSVVSGDRNKLEFGIALGENSRGSSAYFHQTSKIGEIIQISRITTDISIAGAASNHVFIVGGIGITAFLSLMEAYNAINWNLTLHYAIRDKSDVPFLDRITALGDKVVLYDKAKGHRMDVSRILRDLSWNSQVYVCGPPRMMEAVRRAAAEVGLDEDEIHYEAFEADTSGEAFAAEVANRGNMLVDVGEEETLLEVLQRVFGEDVASSCEVGNCGTCKVGLKHGMVDHRGTALAVEERESAMLACVSRGVGRIAIEI
jgi:ferredoxin-NADP reductase